MGQGPSSVEHRLRQDTLGQQESWPRNLKQLRWLAFLLPAAALLLLEVIRYQVFVRFLPRPVHFVVALAVMLAGAFIFSRMLFRIAERMERRILQQNRELVALHTNAQHRNEQMEALTDAALAMTSELSLQAVLQKVVDLARRVAQASYGALAVRDEEGLIKQFVVSGLTPEEAARIGSPPTGKGVLGIPLESGRPLRLADLTKHPHSLGFPPYHPPMRSFLGVPIQYKSRTFGQLYLTEKQGASGFTAEDERVMVLFANQAAVAIENARLYERVQTLAVLEDRERIARDLHDSIIQSIYAVGLSLENLLDSVPAASPEARERLSYAIDHLNDIIRDIRNYIFNLRPHVVHGKKLVGGLDELVAELQLNTLLDVELRVQEGMDQVLSTQQTSTLLQIAREGLTNIIKHARARTVWVSATFSGSDLELRIQDDGVGFDPQQARSAERQGLSNMQGRAYDLGGKMSLESGHGKGTTLTFTIPLSGVGIAT